MTVEFRFTRESEPVAGLNSARPASAVRYFFDRTFLNDEFFEHRVRREVNDVGQRYVPKVHIELEVADLIDGGVPIRGLADPDLGRRPRRPAATS